LTDKNVLYDKKRLANKSSPIVRQFLCPKHTSVPALKVCITSSWI